MKNILKKFYQEEDGATAVEYGVLLAFVATAIIAILTTIGVGINSTSLGLSGTIS